jgi:5-hydroxyisourate hydrolase-like protein (transthyretin family)
VIKKLFTRLLIFVSFFSYSDQIMGTVSSELHIKTVQDLEYDLQLEPDELVAVYLDDNSEFLDNINIEFNISDSLKNYADGFIFTVYSNISREPHENMSGLSGTQIFMSTLPYMNRSYVIIPIEENESDTIPGMLGITPPLETSDFPVIIQVQPVIKGLPEMLFTEKILFTFTPKLEKKGILNLTINKPEGYGNSDITVLLDDEEVSLSSFPMILRSGIHSIKVRSDVFNEENISVAITPGNTEYVEVNLEQSISTLTFNIEPLEGASIYLDGEKIEVYQGQRIVLTTGEHTVRFKIGDYNVSKGFTTELGTNYEISLFFDIHIKED